jgi:hypothetical protein
MQAQILKLLKELRARHDTGILNARLQRGTASWSRAASASSSADIFRRRAAAVLYERNLVGVVRAHLAKSVGRMT